MSEPRELDDLEIEAEDPDNPSGECYWCAGEGWDECHDPIECTSQHSRDGLCRCGSCGGSGLAKDMTIW